MKRNLFISISDSWKSVSIGYKQKPLIYMGLIWRCLKSRPSQADCPVFLTHSYYNNRTLCTVLFYCYMTNYHKFNLKNMHISSKHFWMSFSSVLVLFLRPHGVKPRWLSGLNLLAKAPSPHPSSLVMGRIHSLQLCDWGHCHPASRDRSHFLEASLKSLSCGPSTGWLTFPISLPSRSGQTLQSISLIRSSTSR